MDDLRERLDRAVAEQTQEQIEESWAIRDAAVYGVGWIKYVWDAEAGRARPVRVHPNQVQLLSEFEAMRRD